MCSLRTKSLREQVSAEEWETRVDLAACYRLVALYGMTDLVYNHITARVPASNHVLINPYGMLYEEITASSLIKIDLDGNTVCSPNTTTRSTRPATSSIVPCIRRGTMPNA